MDKLHERALEVARQTLAPDPEFPELIELARQLLEATLSDLTSGTVRVQAITHAAAEHFAVVALLLLGHRGILRINLRTDMSPNAFSDLMGFFVRIQAREALPKPLTQVDGGGDVVISASATSTPRRKQGPEPAGGALFQLGVVHEERRMITCKLLGKANDVSA